MRGKLFSFAGHFEFCGQLVWSLEPANGDGCSEDPIASRLDISSSEDSWLHTSHQLSQLTDKFKTNMNIIFKSNVRALPRLSVSPSVFQRSQICDTHAYFHHLITCANQRMRIGSGNTRFFCFTSNAFKQQKQCLWCIITSSRVFFYGKSPRDERSRSRGNVATFMLGSLWVSRAVTVKSRVAYFRIGEYLWGRWIGERIGVFWKCFCPGLGVKGRF